MVDISPGEVWSALPDGSNVYVNSRFVEYLGMSLVEWLQDYPVALTFILMMSRSSGPSRIMVLQVTTWRCGYAKVMEVFAGF